VALLLLLVGLREKLGVVLSVVHFNHRLRGRASDADEKFVAALAKKLGLTFYVERGDVARTAKREKANLEDTARRARYAFFEQLVQEERVDCVAVAHTADDQAETVLAHILRGTGIAGLGGIHPVAGHVIRPLLSFRRAELRAYLKSRKQTWREDLTNRDTTRMRARIRKKLLPLLEKQFQPAVVDHLTTLAQLAREDEAFFEAELEKKMAAVVEGSKGELRIRVEDLVSSQKEEGGRSNSALSKRLVRRIVGEVKTRAGEIGASHVDAVLRLARQGQSGKTIQLPGSVEVRRQSEELVFLASQGKGRKSGSGQREFAQPVDLSSSETCVRVPELSCVFRFTAIDWPSKRGETKERDAVLDRERLRSPLVLRSLLPGDTLDAVGRQNAHKLKRLLNEKHVSRWEREGWPVLTSSGKIAWARGLPVGKEFAANERTQTGIVIAEESF